MNILVVNGSPKGEFSITLQTVNYLQLKFPDHSWQVINAGASIKALERDFSGAKQALLWAELILFSYPVYTFLAPSQLHSFIRLAKQSGLDLAGRWASQLTTSKHFYDITAHRFIEDNCRDMGLRVVRGLSADMDDLLAPKGREEAEKFMRYLLWSIQNGISEEAAPTAAAKTLSFDPEQLHPEEKEAGDVVIITDCSETDSALDTMIRQFRAALPIKSRVVNIRDIGIKGGCLGCFACASRGECIYTDGFDSFLRQSIQTADAMVYAFTVLDHSMGPLFKMYDDRQFCNGHRTVNMGTPVGYIVNGSLAGEENLRTVIEARAQVGGNFLCGVATNEKDPQKELLQLSQKLCYAIANRHTQPSNFYGVGGMKIFRDLIWLMQGMMRADYRFFKAHGQLDFPQKKRGTMLAMYLVGFLNSSPKLRKKMGTRMSEGMLMPYRKVLEKYKNP